MKKTTKKSFFLIEMISALVVGVIALAALAVVIMTRDSSVLWIASLVGFALAAFFLAERADSLPLLLLFALPLGVYLSWFARDELIPGRPWFLSIVLVALLAGSFFLLRGATVFVYALTAVALCSGSAFILSYQRGWTRKRGQWKSKV